MKYAIRSAAVFAICALGAPASHADLELPRGSLAGCPFIHDDVFDLGPVLETLKVQLESRLDGKNKCLQSMQSIYSNLSGLQNFYASIDPAMKYKITQGVYSSAILSLERRRAVLESTGQSGSLDYATVLGQISALQSSALENEIGMQYSSAFTSTNQEALLRTQLLGYTSGLLNAYTATARTSPQCIDTMGGWNQALAAVFGGFSVATGMGMNPTAHIIGAATNTANQLILLLKDAKVRKAYNDLLRLKNYKTLACTFYSLQRATCEYRRALKVSGDFKSLQRFMINQFGDSSLSPAVARYKEEYDRFLVNQGRIARIGEIFRSIAQMGSSLTLDQTLLGNYFMAKAVDFNRLPPEPAPPPPDGDGTSPAEEKVRTWLIAARAAGVSYREFVGLGEQATLAQQFQQAREDIKTKKATIRSVDALLKKNRAFMDTRRYLSAAFPNAIELVGEMKRYLQEMSANPTIPGADRGTLIGATDLISKLEAFINLDANGTHPEPPAEELQDGITPYDWAVINAGVSIFKEIARGAIAQLTTTQSAFALAEKGQDRLTWAFQVIQNGYLRRDRSVNPPPAGWKFIEYSKRYNILADLMANSKPYTSRGKTFRSDDVLTAYETFKDGFKNEMLRSLELADRADEANEGGPEDGRERLKGVTKAHLCALYVPILERVSDQGFFGGGRAARALADCRENHKTLESNHLVEERDFQIDYDDDCTYINYSREADLQDLIADLLKPL